MKKVIPMNARVKTPNEEIFSEEMTSDEETVSEQVIVRGGAVIARLQEAPKEKQPPAKAPYRPKKGDVVRIVAFGHDCFFATHNASTKTGFVVRVQTTVRVYSLQVNEKRILMWKFKGTILRGLEGDDSYRHDRQLPEDITCAQSACKPHFFNPQHAKLS